MILLIYEILLFLLISFSFYLIKSDFMELHFGILTSIFGMFTANLVMYYILLYKSPEYKNKKKFKMIVNIINGIIIVITLIILIILTVTLLKK